MSTGGARIEAGGGQSEAPLVVASSVFDPVRGTCGATPSCSTQDATVLLDGFALPTCDSLCPITSPCADCIAFTTVTISGNQSIKDGETAQFSVTVDGATATAYDWSFTAPAAAGNNPNVTFTPANAASTTTNGHWFASPNSECSASPDAVYTIRCTVTLDNGKTKTVQASLTVNVPWNPAGETNPNDARIVGGPDLTQGEDGLLRFSGIGSMTRVVPPKQIFVPQSSQFFDKTDRHEQVHVDNWAPGNLFGNIFQPSDFFERFLKPLSAPTLTELLALRDEALMRYRSEQNAILNDATNHCKDERRAFAVSDTINPMFRYQICGRFSECAQ